MLGDVLDVFLSEKYVLSIVELKVKTEKFLVLCFDGFSGECTAPELYDFDVEIEDDHTILPSLKTDRFRRNGF